MNDIARAYQPVVQAKQGDYAATALVGTHSVIIAWDADESVRRGLLGFAVRRTDFDPETGEVQHVDWLSGQKRFPGFENDAGIEIRSDQGPFQRFRWSDYSVTAQRSYRYEIFPMRGQPGALERDVGLTLDLRPTEEEADGVGIYVNRGVTAAYSYLKRFGMQKPEEVSDGRALTWLSRGLKESLLAFIGRAQNGDGLRVAIYEFHDRDIADALAEARLRGVEVRIVYDAVDSNRKVTRENEHLLHETGLESIATGRTFVSISHNKFVVLIKDGNPAALWTGSSNFTHNAFNLQTNAALTFEKPELAQVYLDYWNVLSGNPERGSRADGDQYAPEKIEAVMANIGATLAGYPRSVCFSPVRHDHILDAAIDVVRNAQTALFISAPFSMDRSVKDAIKANEQRILEYGLCNSTARKYFTDLRKRNTRFFTPSRLETYMGKTWDAKAFGAHKIHSKIIVSDPWGDNPRVLFGSANFSDESCRRNDENAILVEGDRRLAAVLTTEFMRMLDHYKSREFINDAFNGIVTNLALTEDEEWSRTAYSPTARSHKYRDRQVFVGQE